MSAERDQRIDELLAKQEISEVILRFTRGMDLVDEEMIASCYHADGLDDHNVFRGLGSEFAAWSMNMAPMIKATMHFTGQPLIRVDGDVAQANTYIVAHHIDPPDEEGRHVDLVLGMRYLDRFERRDGKWLIAKRMCSYDWSYEIEYDPERGLALESDWLTASRIDGTDLSYSGVTS